MHKGDRCGAFDVVSHLVHGVGADQDEVSPAPFKVLRGLDHERGQLIPSAFMLEALDFTKIHGPHQALGGMRSAKPCADFLIDDPIIFLRAFPAHSAYQTDGLHQPLPDKIKGGSLRPCRMLICSGESRRDHIFSMIFWSPSYALPLAAMMAGTISSALSMTSGFT